MVTADYNLVVVLGATATGKTALAVDIARAIGGEIISADSRQVYRGLDIGAGKDRDLYDAVPHHLIDIVDLEAEFSLYDYLQHFCRAFSDVKGRAMPILTGGTGLYLDAVLQGYELFPRDDDPVVREELARLSDDELLARLRATGRPLHNTTDILDRARLIRAIEVAEGERRLEGKAVSARYLGLQPRVLGIRFERQALRRRITARLRERLDMGMIDEVERLMAAGVTGARLDMLGLEYRLVAMHVSGELTYNDMYQKLNSAIHRFAKRQETWFRGMERRGLAIEWLEGEEDLLARAMAALQ